MEKRIKIINNITDAWMNSEFFSSATDLQISEFEKK